MVTLVKAPSPNTKNLFWHTMINCSNNNISQLHRIIFQVPGYITSALYCDLYADTYVMQPGRESKDAS